MTSENFMPILFKVLFGFIAINMVINLVLLYTKRMRIYKLLAIYWPCLFFIFTMLATFQTGNLAVTMAYSTSILSMSIFAMIGLEVIGRKFPFKKYALYFAGFYPLTYYLNSAGYGFTVVAMPFAIATATPLVHALIYIHFIDRNKTTRLQKVLGVIYGLMAIHCINFALFRMDPGAQLWGWITSYAIYDSLAILLPSIALEETNLSEQGRLQNLVDERTNALQASNKENENLLKVLLHDISGPLMVTRFYTNTIVGKEGNDEILLDKVKKSQAVMENIILQVKNIYGLKQGVNTTYKNHLNPVALEDCFKEVSFIFSQKLEKKNIKLIFKNQLSPNTKVMADQTTLTHSVLSNLVSNGVKFSDPDSSIIISVKETGGNVILEVSDQGPGISENVISNVMGDKNAESSLGTLGEQGSGYGLTIVKNFVDSYGGQIEFDTRYMFTQPKDYGTNVRITLNRA
jgi:signal transduction histidine kinase